MRDGGKIAPDIAGDDLQKWRKRIARRRDDKRTGTTGEQQCDQAKLR